MDGIVVQDGSHFPKDISLTRDDSTGHRANLKTLVRRGAHPVRRWSTARNKGLEGYQSYDVDMSVS